MEKFKSRKFWVMIVGNIFAMAIFLWPEHQDKFSELNEFAGVLVSTLTNLGYLIVQGAVDKAEKGQKV